MKLVRSPHVSAFTSMPRVVRVFLAADVMLGLAYLANRLAGSPFARVNRLLDLDGEANLPTWYSSMQWAAAAALLAFVCWRQRERRSSAWPVALAVAATFVLLSADEVAQVHEKLSIGVSQRMGAGQGRFKGMWLPAFGLPVMAFVGVCVKQMKGAIAQAPGSSRLLILGLAVFAAGAFGLEPVLNLLNVHAGTFLVLLEETMEMVGVTFILWAALVMARSEGLFEVGGAGQAPEADGN